MQVGLTRNQLLEKFLTIRETTLKIIEHLSIEDNNLQADAFVSPNKWHLGHTTWFFETFVLHKFISNYKWYNEGFLYYLNSYYESKGKRILKNSRSIVSRPSFQEIITYRKIIEEQVISLLTKSDNEELIFLIELGLQHEQQHQELLMMDIKYNLFHGINFPAFLKGNPKQCIAEDSNDLIFDGGVTQIGFVGESFFFDNEKGVHKQFLHPYSIESRKITNGEYLEFVKSGAYSNPNLWHSDGYKWLKDNNIKHPLYWIEESADYYEYTFYGVKDLDENKPVSHISYYEASAYARYKNKRLPTEFEWENASNKYQDTKTNLFENVIKSNLEPITNGEINLIGNLWEWTTSAYLPYPFYKQDKGALGEYNGKFMANQFVLRGGSGLTPKTHIRNTYRNFFYPTDRWMAAGIRLAEYIK